MFDDPLTVGVVTVAVLLAAIALGRGFPGQKQRAVQTQQPAPEPGAAQAAVKPSIGVQLLRWLRGFVGLYLGMAIVGLLPAFTWLADGAAITEKMVALLLMKLVMATILAAAFEGLRALINHLHRQRAPATPTPLLRSVLTL